MFENFLSIKAQNKIRANGPPVKEFDPIPSVRRWLKNGHKASDDKSGRIVEYSEKERRLIADVTYEVPHDKLEWKHHSERSNLFQNISFDLCAFLTLF